MKKLFIVLIAVVAVSVPQILFGGEQCPNSDISRQRYYQR